LDFSDSLKSSSHLDPSLGLNFLKSDDVSCVTFGILPGDAALTISRRKYGVNALMQITVVVGTIVMNFINGVILFNLIWIAMESVMCVTLHPYPYHNAGVTPCGKRCQGALY